MARTNISVETIDRDAVSPTATAVIADGHQFLNDGKLTFLLVQNGVTQFTLTMQTAKTVDGEAVADKTVTINASTDYLVGPFPAEIYNQSDGKVYIDYSDITDGTVSPLRLGY